MNVILKPSNTFWQKKKRGEKAVQCRSACTQRRGQKACARGDRPLTSDPVAPFDLCRHLATKENRRSQTLGGTSVLSGESDAIVKMYRYLKYANNSSISDTLLDKEKHPLRSRTNPHNTQVLHFRSTSSAPLICCHFEFGLA